MILLLRALDANDEEREIGAGKPFSMGRGPDNDWVLADPGREISKLHCRIDGDGASFVLTDLSINGVHLEREGRLLGRGNTHKLAAGDVFCVGQHRFGVTLAASGAAAQREPLAPVPDAVAGILSGEVVGAEPRASGAVAGEAQAWLRQLPEGSAAAGIAEPYGWTAPPATGVSILPPDVEQPASEFANATEHAAATATALSLPQARPLLPLDWNGDTTATPALPRPAASPVGPAEGARRKLGQGARISAPDIATLGDDALFERAGTVLRALVEGLDAIEAAQAAAEHECGLAVGGGAGLWADFLASTRDPCVTLLVELEAEAGQALARRIASLADRQRALGAAVADAIRVWDERLAPDSVAAETVPRLAVGPLGKAVLWARYVAAHGEVAGPAADGEGRPLVRMLRDAFGRRLAGLRFGELGRG